MHCPKVWVNLAGSTSTPLKHIREMHYGFLTEEQNHVDVQKLDTLLGNFIISSTGPIEPSPGTPKLIKEEAE